MQMKDVVLGMTVQCVDGELSGTKGTVIAKGANEVKVRVKRGRLEWWPLHNLTAVKAGRQ